MKSEKVTTLFAHEHCYRMVCQNEAIITDIWFVPVQHRWVLPCQADIITGDELWKAWGCDCGIACVMLNVNTLVACSPARCCLVTCCLPAPTANNTAVPGESGFLLLPLYMAPPSSLCLKISNWMYVPLLLMGGWRSSVPVVISHKKPSLFHLLWTFFLHHKAILSASWFICIWVACKNNANLPSR